MVKLKQPNWFFTKDIYNNTKTINGYKKFMLSFIESLKGTNENIEQDIQRMYELEKEIAMVSFRLFIEKFDFKF